MISAEREQLKLWWFSTTINFGDQLNPFLIEKMTGKIPRFTPREDNALKYLIIGSIIWGDLSRCIVWGSGLIGLQNYCNRPHKIHAVRGPLTRIVLQERGIQCPEIYGDPALLAPLFFQPKVPKKFKIGIIPHYVDQSNPWLNQFKRDPNILIIDVHLPADRIIEDILSCECIASSSLHGIIVADAYGLPTCWVEFSDKVIGNGFKFKDYFLSVGINPPRPLRIDPNSSLKQIIMQMKEYPTNHLWENLIRSCPFHIDKNKIIS